MSGVEKTKKCPNCSEEILATAKKCKFCSSDLRGWGARHPIISTIFFFIAVGYVVSFFDNSTPSISYPSANQLTNISATQDVGDLLELQNFRVNTESSFVTITGEVKNISNKPLENVTAVGIFSDKDGNFIKSDEALINYNPLLVNQTSPFEVITTDNPEIKKGRVEFKYLMGGTISTRIK